MTLFLVGVIELVVAASWTRSVTKSSAAMNGVISFLHVFVWYYVIDQVVNHLNGWTAIVPYAAGCALGSMLGGMDPKKVRTQVRRLYRRHALRFMKPRPATRRRKIATVPLNASVEN